MKRIMIALATVGALVGGGALAMQLTGDGDGGRVLHPQRIVIGLDLSRSNPLIADPAFAARVGARIADIVRNLDFSSEVHVRTFGSYDPTSNNFAYDVVLSVRNRPEIIAAQVQRLIAGTPQLVRSGKWRSQENTNILAFLDNVSESIGCSGMSTTVVLASDGIEDSDYTRLTRRDSHLPDPGGRLFQGCASFEIYGLGQGTDDPRMTTHLRQEWSRWARGAGFARFQGLNDW